MTNKQINYYDDRGKVRNKIGIWLGSNTHQAVIHTIKELTANSGDILMEGLGSEMVWTIYDNKTVEIYDDCSGLPIEGQTIIKKRDVKGNETTEVKSNYELLLLTLFAGTKHNGLETGETNTGANGVFNTVLTYSSEYVEYEAGRPDGNIYFCSFKEGFIDEDLQIIGKTNKTYTRIKYRLSDQVYTENYFIYDEICDICEKQSALIQKPIKIIDVLNNQEKTYYLSNGLDELFNVYTHEKENSCENIIIEDTFDEKVIFENKEYIDNMKYKLILNYTKDEKNINIDFLNRSELIHHGTIYDGILDGLRKSIHQFISKEGLYNKKESNISKDDILCGLNYIIDFTSLHPNMFSNQTKFETKVKYFKTHLTQSIIKFFEIYSIENKEEMLKIANKLLINKRSREKAETNRKDIRKQLEEKVTNVMTRPNKFVPCRCKDPKKIKFTIIEGDSSLNSIKLARDPYDTCILPLKGKPINPFKCKLSTLLNNQEVRAIYQIMGCGMVYNNKPIRGIPLFDINKMQVNSLEIGTDFDFDGFHIQCLVIGIIYRLSPELLKQGKVYILYTPLYVIRTKQKVKYKDEETNELLAYSETERNNIIKMLHSNNMKFKETRFKGLGGLPVSIMSKALNDEYKILKQITMEDVEKSKEWLELFLSDDKLQERKHFIETYGKEYFDYSLFE